MMSILTNQNIGIWHHKLFLVLDPIKGQGFGKSSDKIMLIKRQHNADSGFQQQDKILMLDLRYIYFEGNYQNIKH